MFLDVCIQEDGVYLSCHFNELTDKTRKWLLETALDPNSKEQLHINEEESISHLYIKRVFYDEFRKFQKYELRKIYDKNNSTIRIKRENKAGGFFIEGDIQAMYEAQSAQCYYCKCYLLDHKNKPRFEIEHLIPLADKGTNWPDNIALSCKKCNQKKGDNPEGWFWSFLRKRDGKEAITLSKKENKKLKALTKKLTKQRKEELLLLYIFEDSTFYNIQKIADNENIDLSCINECEFRRAIFIFTNFLVQKIKMNVFKKLNEKSYKIRNYTLQFAEALILETLHCSILKKTYNSNDAKKRFDLNELYYDIHHSSFINDKNKYDFIFEEINKDIIEFDIFKKAINQYIENKGIFDFLEIEDAFLNIYQKYKLIF